MMMGRMFKPLLMILCTLLLLQGGCAGTPPSKFYMLESLGGAPALQGTAALDQAVTIGLGPVRLPDYLDRPQIVTRARQNSVQIAEFERWAEPLSSNVSRVLAENLIFLLQSDSVVPYPWPGSIDVAYQVVVDVYRFDGILGDKALLEAQWSILGKKGKKVLILKRSMFIEPVGESSLAALVSAQSRALGNFSRELAEALQNLVREGVK
jgi:uncharacterized protein